MAKRKAAACKGCGSSDALYVQLGNGERLPSYVMKIGDGIYCNPCAKGEKNKCLCTDEPPYEECLDHSGY